MQQRSLSADQKVRVTQTTRGVVLLPICGNQSEREEEKDTHQVQGQQDSIEYQYKRSVNLITAVINVVDLPFPIWMLFSIDY